MKYLSDIEIAQACDMKPIAETARTTGIDEKYIEILSKYSSSL